jgi:hypothetical protein
MLRLLLAALVGGLLMFIGGAFSHTVLQMESRVVREVGDEAQARTFVSANAPDHGVYSFPMGNPEFEKLSAEEQEREWERLNEAFKTGPAAMIFVQPRGEDMMGPKQLVGEFLFDVAAALAAAIVIMQFSRRSDYGVRWLMVLLIGISGWLALSTSQALWWRFPWVFVLDGLYVTVIEWGLAGLAIALFIKPSARPGEEDRPIVVDADTPEPV